MKALCSAFRLVSRRSGPGPPADVNVGPIRVSNPMSCDRPQGRRGMAPVQYDVTDQGTTPAQRTCVPSPDAPQCDIAGPTMHRWRQQDETAAERIEVRPGE